LRLLKPKNILLGTVLIGLVIGVWQVWPWGRDVYRRVQMERVLIREVSDLIEGDLLTLDLGEVEILSRISQDNLEGLQNDLEPLYPVLEKLAWLPWAGNYIAEVEPAVNFGIEASRLGVELAKAAAPVRMLYDNSGDEDTAEIGVLLPEVLPTILDNFWPALEAVSAQLDVVREARGEVHPELWPEKYRTKMAVVDAALPQLDTGLATGKQVLALLEKGQTVFEQAKALTMVDPLAIDLDEAAVLVGDVERILVELQAQMEALTPNLEPLASKDGVGSYIAQIEPALQFGVAAAQLGEELVEMVGPFKALFDGELSGFDLSSAVVDRLVAAEPDFEQLEARIDALQAAREKMNIDLLPGNYRGQLARLDEALVKLEAGLVDARLLPEILGAGKPKTYLIMVQNRDELRGTGGFITSFGLLRLDDGRISMLEFEDSTRLDFVSEVLKPPEAMSYLMGANYWVPRDANWSPDFPTAAQQVQELYYSSTAIPTDGVIAIDESLLEAALAFTGPVKMAEENTIVSSENMRVVMIRYRNEAVHAGEKEKRKYFMALIMRPLMQEVLGANEPEQMQSLVHLAVKMMGEGHLLVYLNDAVAQAALERREMDGRVDAGGGDFVMLVDSNVGISKVDMYIERALHYTVDLRDPVQPQGVVTARYTHTQAGVEPCFQTLGSPGGGPYPGARTYGFSRCYWDYWRVYLAGGAMLMGSEVEPTPPEWFFDGIGWQNGVEVFPGENGTTVIGGLLVVPQEDTREVVLEIDLLPGVVQQDGEGTLVYTLRVQKQAGIQSLPFEIEISAPNGYATEFNMAGWESDIEHNHYSWRGEIAETLDVKVTFIKTE
jgi:hypothetical protein